MTSMHPPTACPRLPNVRAGTPADFAALGCQLGIRSHGGLTQAAADGVLRFVEVPARAGSSLYWILADEQFRVEMHRWLAGVQPIEKSGKFLETEAVYQGDPSFPIGLDAIGTRQRVLLVAGAENGLAAYEYFRGFTVLSILIMLDATPINESVLPCFAGREVLLADLHPATAEAYQIWRQQLSGVASTVRNISVDGWDEEGGPLDLWGWCRSRVGMYEEVLAERRVGGGAR